MYGRKQYYTCVTVSCNGGLDFAVPANFVKLYLDTTGPLYVTFATTMGSTGSGMFPMTSGDSPLTVTEGLISGMGFMSTTTEMSFRVYALSQ